MKNGINKAIFMIALLVLQIVAHAQTHIFCVNYVTKGRNYDVLMVMSGNVEHYADYNYFRTAYYDRSNNFTVVNQTIKISNGTYTDGRAYTTVNGYNVSFVRSAAGAVYNPDTYTLLHNSDGSNALYEGDINHMSKPVSYARELRYDELKYEFLKKFFNDGEPQLAYLLSLNGAVTPNAQMQQAPPPVSNVLILQNNTGNRIDVSFVYFDKGQNCWISRGWRTIEDGSTNPINLDELSMGSSVMYVHAQDGFGHIWGGDNYFCAEIGRKFQISYADQNNCGDKFRYRQVNLVAGTNYENFTSRR